MNASEVGYVSAIASLSGVGPKRLRVLWNVGEPGRVWERIVDGSIVSVPEIATMLGARRDQVTREWRVQAAAIEPSELARFQQVRGITLLLESDARFPQALRTDVEPPCVLWALGDLDGMAPHRVAIVGTRRCTRYGHDVARRFGEELSRAGISVVSGLALGVDAAAHAGALETQPDGAQPVAIVGTGVDVVYPTRNRTLWERVERTGVIMSESPPGSRADAWRFPARNRLIAALSDVVVVVESQERGGSMYTVDEAILRSIEVRAVPGPITSPSSSGTNRLLADGATPALSAAEIIEHLGYTSKQVLQVQDKPFLGDDAFQVLDALTSGPSTLDELADATGLAVGQVAFTTTQLQAGGQIVRSGGWYERSG